MRDTAATGEDGRVLQTVRESRWVRWGQRHLVLLLTLAVGGAVALAFAVASAEVYDAVTDEDGVAGLDMPVLEAAVDARSPALDEAVTAYTDVGGVIGMPILATLAAVTMALAWRRLTPVVVMVVAGGGSLLLTVVGKPLVGRERPDLADAVPPYETSASFPSGHTLNATVVAGVVAYLLVLHVRRLLGRVATIAAAAVFAVTMGLSRVYLGHHWLTDVVVAWTLGLTWLAVVVVAHQVYLARWPEEHAEDPAG